jgi:hypothetical protein
MDCFHDPVNKLKLNPVSTVVCRCVAQLVEAVNELRPPPACTLTVNHSALLYIDVCQSLASETGLKARNVEKRINAV